MDSIVHGISCGVESFSDCGVAPGIVDLQIGIMPLPSVRLYFGVVVVIVVAAGRRFLCRTFSACWSAGPTGPCHP